MAGLKIAVRFSVIDFDADNAHLVPKGPNLG